MSARVNIGVKMAHKAENNNATRTEYETWKLLMNIVLNNGAIQLYLNIWILWLNVSPCEFRSQKGA